MGVNNQLDLGVGHVSQDALLGQFYQDFTPALYHYENDSIGGIDEEGIPYFVDQGQEKYGIVYVIQFALIQHDLILKNDKVEYRRDVMLKCLEWLHKKAEVFKDAMVWRSPEELQYGLKEGWVSAMSQGQGISLFLRAAQMFDKPEYIEFAKKLFVYFRYDYDEGGAKRIDTNGYWWLEEYPTDPPSYVLNGYVYTLFGILDLYRVTNDAEVKQYYDEGIRTIEDNVKRYHRFYWTVYDQQKKELVSYYYQKNVHIPLMSILYLLTKKDIFKELEAKWTKQLNNRIYRILVQIMYRVQPRIRKILN